MNATKINQHFDIFKNKRENKDGLVAKIISQIVNNKSINHQITER